MSTTDRHDFAGRVALVSGGASGIGRATAGELLRRGARVVVIDRAPVPLGPEIDVLRADVTRRDEVDEAVARAVERHGRLDVLVNCAGIESRGTVEDLDDEECTRLLDVNVVGMLRTMRAAVPHLKQSTAGAIVNMSSVCASRGMAGLALYSASKGAVLAMTRSVAADLLPHGVRVNCVSPGTVNTPWVGRLLESSDEPEAVLEVLRSRQPMGRLVDAEEVAGAVAYLASPATPSVTGTSLDVDGGLVSLSLAPDVTVAEGASRAAATNDVVPTSRP